MSLKVEVSICFPCSDDDWMKLNKIKLLFSNIGLADKQANQLIPQSSLKIDNMVDSEIIENISDKEAEILDVMTQRAHENGETPFMNALEEAENKPIFKRKRNASSKSSTKELMFQFLNLNNKATRQEIIKYICTNRPDLLVQSVESMISTIATQCKIVKENGYWSLPASVEPTLLE